MQPSLQQVTAVMENSMLERMRSEERVADRRRVVLPRGVAHDSALRDRSPSVSSFSVER
jgi:hypothetical protein